jgi:hypothetical protein
VAKGRNKRVGFCSVRLSTRRRQRNGPLLYVRTCRMSWFFPARNVAVKSERKSDRIVRCVIFAVLELNFICGLSRLATTMHGSLQPVKTVQIRSSGKMFAAACYTFV